MSHVSFSWSKRDGEGPIRSREKRATISSSDWANGPGTGETAAATMSYRNADGDSSQAITMYVYATTVPIDSSKTVASVTFPDISNTVSGGTSAMHIFAVTTG